MRSVLICRYWRAYPRSHGATTIQVNGGGGMQGLSPLARGNLAPMQSEGVGSGPIPARTGQPN